MSKLVVFSFLGGDLNQGFPVVTAQLWCHNQFVPVKLTGSLPPAPELSELYRRWQLLYAAVHQRLGSHQRIKVHSQDITNISINDFDEVCQQLQVNINTWLRFESFQNIEGKLRTLLSRHDEIRVIIETNIVLLHRLPWHLWHFFEDYPKAELALSNHEYESPQLLQKSPTGKVKILAILGNRVGIDIEKDASLLQGLTDAQTTFLIQPTRQILDKYLWNQDWDILFFAGHSNSLADGEIGEICINQTEILTILQLRNGLKAAIRRGLKLAIFNSCDGIGLGRNLADLNIPQMIVMREGVPDLIAQEFLKNFLTAFADSKPFYLAVREARERLQGLENEFPCASWLPVICQNPTTVPITWQELHGNCGNTKFVGKVSTKGKIATPKLKLWTVLLSTLIVAISTLGLRYLGIFEKIELQSFDQMLRLRPKEDPDSRLIIVEITEKDIQSRQETTKGLKSISDRTLAQLLNKLQKYQPRVVGLDIYRDFADPQNKSNLIQLPTELNKDNVVVVCKSRDSKYDPQGVKPPKDVPVGRQGFTDAIKDPDGIVRRQILMMAQEPSSTCTTPYSLSLQLVARYLSYENIQPKFNQDYVQFGSKVFKRLKPSRSGGYQQRVDLGGNQILVNYRNTDYQRVSLNDVLSDKFDRKSLKDKLVLIGVTANTVSDTWSTPYSTAQQDYQEISGIFIQAQMVSQVLSAVLDQRPILWVLPYWGDILWICGWSIVGNLIIWRMRSLSHQRCAIFVTVVILYGVCAIALLKQGLWLPFIPSAFALVLSGVLVIFIQNRREFSTTPQSLDNSGEEVN
ncbi:MAG: CHASE2 domain-containing protein [Nostoc sp. EfeVER01]|uniref:CHASE2 domain-containing protein n=1 Tax=unclassified Nostoc TaxID=2593658 RepID=UPI002AD2E490|nr:MULTISPECIES: CHASE2 domain-containing protein [unclassified Nostoc]MDZ7943760.1 CHASE2 domain-containing protein [Nostoc sp. EfeVER01]MDZ7990809.1 CHASE2 domain-containing protein [Nostoc sp. EspVER01]